MIIQPVVDVTLVTADDSTNVIYQEQVNLVVVQDDSSIVVYQEPTSIIIETGLQGPPGPPTGIGTEITDLIFIGSGTGATKTTTKIIGNLIFEEFGIGDEVYTYFTFPHGFDRTKDATFYGVWFPTSSDGPGYTSSWEIHVTTHNHTTQDYVTDVITVTDLAVPANAYTMVEGTINIDHTYFNFADFNDMHIKLKRVASTNDPPNGIGIPVLNLIYNTDARVGEQGPQGIQGPAGDEEVPYTKKVDFITDDLAYLGEAAPGSATNAAVWRIKYAEFFGDGDVSITWASGDSNFDKIWDNRAGYTYT